MAKIKTPKAITTSVASNNVASESIEAAGNAAVEMLEGGDYVEAMLGAACDVVDGESVMRADPKDTLADEVEFALDQTKAPVASISHDGVLVDELPDLIGDGGNSESSGDAQPAMVEIVTTNVAISPDPPKLEPLMLSSYAARRSEILAEMDAEDEWKRELRTINDEFMELAIEEKHAKEHAKELKKAMDEKVKQRQRLLDRGPEKPRPLFDQQARSATLTVGPPTGATVQVELPIAAPQSDAWRAVSVSELDLGDSLTQKLDDSGLSTFGKLEDHRAAIALGKEKWPKGIGEAKITKIENAVIAWLTANRDKSIFSQPVVGDGVAETSAAAEVAEASQNEAIPTDAEIGELTEDQWLDKWDKTNAVVNIERPDVSTPEGLSHDMAFKDGYERGITGDEITGCPYKKPELQDWWMRGYVVAERYEKNNPSSDVVDEDNSPPVESSESDSDLDETIEADNEQSVDDLLNEFA